MKKVAALDLGSNSFLCLIAEGEKSEIKKVLVDESRIVKLAQGLLNSGELHPEALARAETTLKEFRAIIDNHKPDTVKAVATAAVREAKNKQLFFALLSKHNIPLEILSGDEEAETTFQGAFGSELNSGEQILFDIGGGSTEVIWGTNGKINWAHSFPIGVVKLTEKFIPQQPFDLGGRAEIEMHLRNIFCDRLDSFKEKVKTARLRAVAGTPTTLAGIMVGGYDSVKVDGFQLTKKDLNQRINLFAGKSVREIDENYKIGGRSEVILAGCFLLEFLRDYFGQDSIQVSIRGVRYGLAQKLLQ